MSKQARIRQSRAQEPQSKPRQTRLKRASGAPWRSPALWAVAAIVATAVVLALALSKATQPQPVSTRVSSGLAPAFTGRDVSSGAPITSSGLRGRNVLLFFSEGVMCQACLEQIQSLEQRSAQLRQRELTLISITTDPPETLRQAVREYDITTPMISDQSRATSSAYGAVGQGMHPDTDGHTFVLIDRTGHIRWRRDYTTMYIPPERLLGEIPKIS